ncbi:triacylglycerol lipase OBL1 [Musa acuminata AAA Group]|uniref:triacylglycerol lipase OBL1 n=1 Tax=Musa acuminata AAA Group TaxID=214697 RepID=UPI0031CE37C4
MGAEAEAEAPPTEYFIIRPKKIRLIDILSLLILRKSLTSYKFVDSSGTAKDGLRADWVTALTLLIMKVLDKIKVPLKWTGIIVEFIFNLFELNGGIGIIWRIITGKLVIPKRDSADFRSMIALIDGRQDLYKNNSLLHYFPLMEPQAGFDDINLLDITAMAAKIAYENPAYIENTVTNHWKMHFVGFYDCWNKFLEEKTTQAFIFCNKAEDADLIVLSFRGTEPFNAQDWSTDVDLSTLLAGKLGLLHLGFLKALGLQNETNFILGFPTSIEMNADKPVAYYILRQELRNLLAKHKNAKIIVTGHSLGGALSAVFPALLSYHNQNDILNSMHSVMNYGQPRVGDAIFKSYVNVLMRVKYQRMVYRYDIVPRIPFDLPPLSNFKHCGKCIYFDGWYKGKVVDEVPNPNYFLEPLSVPRMYLTAWGDLFRAFFIGYTAGKDFKEGIASILYRLTGLVLPGIACHSPRDYVNSVRLAKIENTLFV